MFFIAILITVVSLVLYLAKQMQKPPNFPPGPVWLPFVGSLYELKRLSKLLGGQHHALQALAQKYKTDVLGLKLGNEHVVTVFSYPFVREVLTNDVYDGRPDNFFLKLRCLGKKNGITCTEGETWSSQRNFVNRHLRNLGFGKKPMEVMIRDEIAEVLSILQSNGCNVSVDKFLAPSILNVIWVLITGERIPREDSLLKELLDLFHIRSRAFDMTGGTLSQYPWLRHIVPEWSGYNLIQKVNTNMKDFFMKIIREHQQTWEEGKNEDLIYRYISEMQLNNKNGEDFNEDQLVMICLDLFIAGAQTTSGTLDFAFLLMVMYPDVQKRVQEEIDKYFGKNWVIEYADRHKAPYVEAVLLEVMRFRHVLPIIGPRRVMHDTVLGEYVLPKDTTILISLYSVHNSSKYWKNSESFMPERFLDENGSLIANEKLIPFGLGRRRCLGEILAKTAIFMFFVEILRKYTVTLSPDSEAPTARCLPGITLSPVHYSAKFVERS